MQPMQMAKKNSRPAKNVKRLATIKEASFKLSIKSPPIAVDIKKPSRAANILGALSIILTGKFSELFSE